MAAVTAHGLAVVAMVILSILFATFPAIAAETLISGLRFGMRDAHTRIVLDLDANVPIETSLSADRTRLEVIVPQARWALPIGRLPQPRGLVDAWYTSTTPGAASLEVDLKGQARVANAELLVPSPDSRFYRLVIDLIPGPAPALAAPAQPEPAPPAAGTNEETAERVAPQAAAGRVPPVPTPKVLPRPEAVAPPAATAGIGSVLEAPAADQAAPAPVPAPVPIKPLIVLDPGHGGKDPGTIGRRGTYEKTITLAVAKAIKARLEESGRYRVALTRDRDKAVPLRQRLNFAREAGGALFISIHADSLARNAEMRGASVYTLSDRASDREAAALAQKENKADIVSGLDLTDQDPIVSEILIDLALRDATNRSIGFADALVRELGKVTRLVKGTRRFAGFVVLKSPDTPSVLLELGFLSNPRDEQLLNDPGHRRKVAGAVLNALDAYFAIAPH
ncbi:MAG TPA: N-acetylmuramoyl-L-alanine amidase [Geminicoccus sp.]|uniref:N-acetylmuramoyl-L-alanine amidase family protein n=1 Tax=Geminicoccus sp. TaxID=2024832 RepID=UPI002C666077|nr:N-acetylmuramoyl-L-alanine amidase [Geminicoccus sp.]HWL70354.1 N-acetylmuramoyl-L-alanine amidase [Geminicoccus sp.]